MGNDSVTGADLRVQAVLPKAARSPKRRSPQPENEHDADSPAEQAPPPGMGKLVDKSA